MRQHVLALLLVGLCKKGDINYLSTKALEKLTDFGYKGHYCNNRITLEGGELKETRIDSL
jgi:hypothetical protein